MKSDEKLDALIFVIDKVVKVTEEYREYSKRLTAAKYAIKGHSVMYKIKMINGTVTLDGPAYICDCYMETNETS